MRIAVGSGHAGSLSTQLLPREREAAQTALECDPTTARTTGARGHANVVGALTGKRRPRGPR